MLYTLHECKIQNRLTSIRKKKKSSFSNARKCLLCSRQASQNRDAVTSLQHEQPWNQRMECFRAEGDQKNMGANSLVWHLYCLSSLDEINTSTLGPAYHS